MRAKMLASTIAAVVCGSVLLVSVAWAASAGVTKVTIRPPNSKLGVHGRVFSRQSPKCTVGRTVEVLKGKGPHQSPSTDAVVAMTTTVKQKKHGVWNTTTTVHGGWFYAYTPKTTGCRAATSPSIHL